MPEPEQDHEPRVFRRKVLARVASRARAVGDAKALAERNPTGEYAVEYTPVVNAREQWRVIHISAVPDGTPDKHPSCEYVRKVQRDMIHESWEW